MMPEYGERRAGPTSSRTLLRAVIMLAAAIVILTGLTTVTIVRLVDQSASQASLGKVEAAQERSLVEGCQRLNVLRVSDNQAHYNDFVVFSFVEERFTVPTKTETPAQKKITSEFTAKLKESVTSSTWTPVTDCTQAVNEHGAAYLAPKPVAFSKRLPPPSALGR